MEHEPANPSNFSHADEALAAYLGDALADKEVLVVGSKDLARELASRNARVTRIVRRDPQKRTRRDDATSVRVWPQGQTVDADCLVIPDIGIFGAEMESRLAEACKWADTIILGVGRDRGIRYEQFYALLVQLGLKPRMYGQAAFRGFALVDFRNAAEADLSFDGSLVASDELTPERYLAVAGMPLTLDGYAIVQAPNAAPRSEVVVSEKTTSEVSPPENVDVAPPVAPARDEKTLQAEFDTKVAALVASQKIEKEGLEGEWGKEVQRLEKALATRAHELLDAREEAERRGKLVRDLTEQLKSISAKAKVVEVVQPSLAAPTPASSENNESIALALTEIASLKRDLEKSHASLVDLEARRVEAALRAEMFEAEASQLRSREPSTPPRQAFADFESQIAQLEEQLIARDKEILSLSSRENSLRDQYRDDKVAAESRAAELSAENTRLASKSDSAEQRLQRAVEASASLQNELSSLRGEREGLRLALEDARASLSARQQATTVAGGVAAPKVAEPELANASPQNASREAMLARALNEVAHANSRRVEALALREESQQYGMRVAELTARVDELDVTLSEERALQERALREQVAECESLREECARLLRNASQQERDARQRDRMRAALLTLSSEAQALLTIGAEGWANTANADMRSRVLELETENSRLKQQIGPVQAVTDRLKTSLGDHEALRRVTMSLGMELEALRRAVLFGDADEASKRIDSLQTMLHAEDQATKLPG